jgi:hypothetical protein
MSAIKTKLSLLLEVIETGSGDLVSPRGTHVFPPSSAQNTEIATGTSDNQIDRVWSDTRSAAGAADPLDVRGGITSQLDGSTIQLADLCLVAIRNKSTTATLSIGGGSNPITGLWGASGDIIKIPPGGIFLWWAPDDGIATVAGTGDILNVDPGAFTIEYDILLAGRSA